MEKIKAIFCVFFGHSNIQNSWFGYFNCGRCGVQVGDSLGSTYPNASNVVIIGHNCEACQKNYKSLTWKDKFLTPNPFLEKEN